MTKKYIIIPLILFGILAGTFAYAQLGGFPVWHLIDNAIHPVTSAWEIGSSALRIAKGWFTDLDATTGNITTFTATDATIENATITNLNATITIESPLVVDPSTNPVITFTGDTDTGIGWISANKMSLMTGNVYRMILEPDGNIDFNDSVLQNIGVAGTDFDTVGGLTLADDLTAINADFSGYASSTIGLNTQGDGHFGGNVTIDGNATTSDFVISGGDLNKDGTALTIGADLTVGGFASSTSVNTSGAIHIGGNSVVDGTGSFALAKLTIDASGNFVTTGYASSTTGIWGQGDLHIGGNTTLDGNATTTGSMYIGQDLTVLNGKVGIGTTSPVYLLDVSGQIRGRDLLTLDNNGDPFVSVGDSGSGGDFGFMRWVSATDALSFGTTVGGTFNDQLIIKESGNVGIGTTTPKSLLTVDGTFAVGTNGTEMTVDASGNVVIGGTLGITGLATFDGDVLFNNPATTTAQFSGIFPTEPSHFAIKEYVDTQPGNAIDFDFTTTTSDIDDQLTYLMEDVISGDDEADIVSGSLTTATDNQFVVAFAIGSSTIPFATMEAGRVTLHIHAERTDGNDPVRFYYTIVQRDDSQSETILITSELSDLVTSKAAFGVHATILADLDFVLTDRLLVKIYANVGGTGVANQLTIYVQGATASRVEVGVPSTAFNAIFLGLDGRNSPTANIDWGGFDLTNIGTSSSTALNTSGALHVGTNGLIEGTLTLPDLANPAGAFAAYDPTGKLIATTTPAGVTPAGSNNEIITDDGSSGIVSESNLTFDGTNLLVTGNASTTAGLFTQGSAHIGGALTIDGNLTVIGTGHDSFSDFVVNEHLDWSADSVGTIHASNYTNNTYTGGTNITLNGSAFDLDDISGTYSVIAGNAAIVTVGALDSGTITSGFGDIETGGFASSTTGLFTQGSGHIGTTFVIEGAATTTDDHSFESLIRFGGGEMCIGEDTNTTTPNITIQACSEF